MLNTIRFGLVIVVLSVYVTGSVFAQNDTSNLFDSEDPLEMRMQFSTKVLRKETNDSTYIAESIAFKNGFETWDSIPVSLRARGNWRRKHCDFLPLKFKFKKSQVKDTPFEGHKKFKMVIPCHKDKGGNDLLLKEYMAYKIYENVSSVHFKTRLVNLEFIEERGKRRNVWHLYAILIEDIDKVCEREGARELKRQVHPKLFHDVYAARNAFFQFLIANTDYSTKVRHNEKMIQSPEGIIPVPYDFDMSGLVNAPYAVVSNVQNLELSIDHVTERAYKGYEKKPDVFQAVRQEFLDNKSTIMQTVDEIGSFFESRNEHERVVKYVNEFFSIMADDNKFKRAILAKARSYD